MNWRDFLQLARRLSRGTAEADWRTAVSRAYYAAFHIARRLFADLKPICTISADGNGRFSSDDRRNLPGIARDAERHVENGSHPSPRPRAPFAARRHCRGDSCFRSSEKMTRLKTRAKPLRAH
jgi:hypothetical protein